jgi:hypothetical protein
LKRRSHIYLPKIKMREIACIKRFFSGFKLDIPNSLTILSVKFTNDGRQCSSAVKWNKINERNKKIWALLPSPVKLKKILQEFKILVWTKALAYFKYWKEGTIFFTLVRWRLKRERLHALKVFFSGLKLDIPNSWARLNFKLTIDESRCNSAVKREKLNKN